MSDYISREYLLKEVEELNAVSFYELNDHSNEAYHEIKNLIELIPAADVVEQKDGKWLIDGYSAICSSCKDIFDFEVYLPDLSMSEDLDMRYCPNCGARMASE